MVRVQWYLNGQRVDEIASRQVFTGDPLGRFWVKNTGDRDLVNLTITNRDGRVWFSPVQGGAGANPLRLGTVKPGGRAVCYARAYVHAVEGKAMLEVYEDLGSAAGAQGR